MARLPILLAGLAAAAALVPAPVPAAEPVTDATLTARLAVFRTPMRHPQDEVRPLGQELTDAESASAALRNSRLIADTPLLRVWAALDDGKLRLISTDKTPSSYGPPPLAGEAPYPAWTAYFLTRGSAGGVFSVDRLRTSVLLVADGARGARLVRVDGRSKRLTIRRSTIVTRRTAADVVVWRDAQGRTHRN